MPELVEYIRCPEHQLFYFEIVEKLIAFTNGVVAKEAEADGGCGIPSRPHELAPQKEGTKRAGPLRKDETRPRHQLIAVQCETSDVPQSRLTVMRDCRGYAAG